MKITDSAVLVCLHLILLLGCIEALHISTANDLFDLASAVNTRHESFSGQVVELDNDIDLASSDWTPIGTQSSYVFAGTFDGHGHEIKGLSVTVTQNTNPAGLFGYVKNCVIQNLVLSGTVTGALHVGGFVGNGLLPVFKNCTNHCDVVATSTDSYAGGFLGYSQSTGAGHVMFDECFNTGRVSSRKMSGGIVGWIRGVVARNCGNTGSIVSSNNAGGISGTYEVTVLNSYNGGSVSEKYGSGISGTGINTCPGSSQYIHENFLNYGVFSTSSATSPTNPTRQASALASYSYGSQSLSYDVTKCGSYCAKYYSSGNLDTTVLGCKTLACALNAWIDKQDDPNLYKRWVKGATIPAIFQRPITITLDANGGSVDPETITGFVGGEFGNPPEPKRSGFAFDGWFTLPEGGIKIEPTSEVVSTVAYTVYAHWLPEVTVTLNPNGGSVSPDTLTVVYQRQYKNLPVPSYPKHIFDDWFLSDGTTKVKNSTIVSSSTAHTLVAHWINIYYVVCNWFDGRKTTIERIDGTEIETLPLPTRDGYEFLGWFTKESGGTQVSNKTVVTSDMDLYQHWAEIITVSFDANGGTCKKKSKIVVNGKQYGDLPEADQEGYIFVGWFLSKDGNDTVTDTSIVQSAVDFTIYAHYSPRLYELFFNTNRGSSIASKMIYYKSPIPWDSFVTTREGFVFIEWRLSNGQHCAIETMPAYSFTVYAHWGWYIYINLDACGGSVSSSYVERVTNTTCGDLPDAERDGFSFLGWFTERNGGTQLEPTTMIKEENVTAYAQWDRNTYYIFFETNGGSPEQPHPVLFDFNIPELPRSAKENYALSGWFLDSQLKEPFNLTRMPSHNVTLYAKWIDAYRVSFIVNDGSSEETVIYLCTGMTYGDLPNVSRSGYMFAGWFTEENGGERIYSDTVFSYSKAVSIYAHWDKFYRISFDAGGGFCDVSFIDLTSGMQFGHFGSLPNASKEGYSFVGWFTELLSGSEVNEDTVFSGVEDATVYAHWSVNSYTITFNTNGGESIPSISLDYGSEVSVPDKAQKDGFVFDGWYLDSDLQYKMEVTTMPARDFIVYAKWLRLFKVTFSADGGFISVSFIYVTQGMTYGHYDDLPSASKVGYEFNGWFTPDGIQIMDSTVFSGDSDSVLYAHWTLKKYSIVFNTNGGTQIASITQDFGSVLTIPTDVEKDGFIFEGWYLDVELNRPMNLTTMPAENIVLYAKWSEVVEVDAGVIIAGIICATIVILGLAYIALACFCSACAFHSIFGKLNIFNHFECGKSLLEKVKQLQDPAPSSSNSSTDLETYCYEAPSAPPTYD